MQEEILATPQEGMNPEQEAVEETTEETAEVETSQENEETVTRSQFNQVLARAKKAEDLLKKNPSAQVITNKQNSLSEEEVEVKILKAQGMEAGLISELRVVAKARNKSLLDSTTDPIFLAIKAQQEADVKATKSRMPASRGASSVKMEKSINSIGLSAEEHKARWNEMRGN